MDDVGAHIDRARGLTEEMIELTKTLLRSGADIDHVHRDYFMRAFELLAEVEAQGLLAVSGDQSSMIAVEDQISQLSRLKQEAIRELDPYADRD